MKAIVRRLQSLEHKTSARDEGMTLILRDAGCKTDCTVADIQALEEAGYLHRGGMRLIDVGNGGEIQGLSNAAREHLAGRRKQLANEESQ